MSSARESTSAYQVVGDGLLDVVFVPRLLSQIDPIWMLPSSARSTLKRYTGRGQLEHAPARHYKQPWSRVVLAAPAQNALNHQTAAFDP